MNASTSTTTRAIPSTDDFRYDLFPVPSGLVKAYYDRMQLGLERMQSMPIVICGLARNVARVLHKTIRRVEAIGSMFKSYRVLVYENDSSDVTAYAMQGWASVNPQVSCYCSKQGQPVNRSIRCPKRATRMAKYRNELREEVVRQRGGASHVIVVDMDMNGGWSLEGIANSFGYNNWDFMGSNGVMFRKYGVDNMRPVYYDVWAFRWAGSDEPTQPEKINPLVWQRGEPPVAINSCFGGLGLYRIEAFEQCSYDGSDCEHVPFHRKMREAGMGRLFMNPSQISLYNHERFDQELTSPILQGGKR